MLNSPELLTRAVEQVTPRKIAEEKLKSGQSLRIYLGIDPTGTRLHLGHSVPLRKLKAFADAGHHVIFLIGSFTAMVGDPTGRDAMRAPLTREEVDRNFQTYKEQASKILDFSKVEVRYNHEWLEQLSFADIMQLSSHFTVQQMLERDMFKERMSWKVKCKNCEQLSNSPIQFQSVESFKTAHLEGNTMQCPHCGKMTPIEKDNLIEPPNPISPNEFMYPLMQGYDSVVLDVDCEIGGNDQLFNMLCGRKLQKVYGKREKFVLTTKLIEGTDGRKMSKTYDNCIWLEDSADEMYGKLMRIRDDLIITYMECVTELPIEQIAYAKKQMEKGSNPKEFKMALAFEVVRLYHGTDSAKHAEDYFKTVFQNKETPEDMAEVKAKAGDLLVDVLMGEGLVPSKSEFRRLVEQSAVKADETLVTDAGITVGECLPQSGGLTSEASAKEVVVKVGKRKFMRINL